MKTSRPLLLLAPLLAGCGSMQPSDFVTAQPPLVLEDYFAGETYAWGLFRDRFGELRRQFNVRIDGRYADGVLTLDEHFCYADGERDRRVWSIRRLSDHRYEGRADDVIGTASGELYGNALRWRYRLDLAVSGRSLRVDFDDWMFLQPGGVLLNQARVSKFGVTLGEVTLAFSRTRPTEPWDANCAATALEENSRDG